MNTDFVVKSISHVLSRYEFSNSLILQSMSISDETDVFDVSLVCFVNKNPSKVEMTSMFTDLLDDPNNYTAEKNVFVGMFGGQRVRISFLDEVKYDSLINEDPLSYESVVLMYDAKILFDKKGVMTKAHKLVNKGGKKLKKSEVTSRYHKAAKKVELLSKAYRDDDVIYFYSLCEQVKEEFTSLLFAMHGKPFFSMRNLEVQIESLSNVPSDFYSNVLLSSQVDSVDKKILIFKRLSTIMGSYVGVSEMKEEYVSVNKNVADDFDLRRIVEDKIKSVSQKAKPLKKKAIDDFKSLAEDKDETASEEE